MGSIKELKYTVSKSILGWIGSIHTPFSSKENIFKDFYKIKDCLKPGDVIITLSHGHLSNFFNRLVNDGTYMHAALFAGTLDGRKPHIIESIGEGVVQKDLALFLSSKDKIAILRPRFLTGAVDQFKVVEYARKQIGKKYDYLFSMRGEAGKEAFYCSELVWFSLAAAVPTMEFTRKHKGIHTVTPNDFYKADKYFELVYETEN